MGVGIMALDRWLFCILLWIHHRNCYWTVSWRILGGSGSFFNFFFLCTCTSWLHPWVSFLALYLWFWQKKHSTTIVHRRGFFLFFRNQSVRRTILVYATSNILERASSFQAPQFRCLGWGSPRFLFGREGSPRSFCPLRTVRKEIQRSPVWTQKEPHSRSNLSYYPFLLLYQAKLYLTKKNYIKQL